MKKFVECSRCYARLRRSVNEVTCMGLLAPHSHSIVPGGFEV
jgi:hypothetical protein